jgi:hypothetical protein
MNRVLSETIEGSQEFDIFKGKVRSGFKLHLLQTKFGRSSEQVESMTKNIARTIYESANLLKIDPNSIRLETSFDNSEDYRSLHGRRKTVAGEAMSEGIMIPISKILDCSTGDFLPNLELTSTIAHELHHVARIRQFPNYFEKLREKNKNLITDIRSGSKSPVELRKLQDEYWAVNTSSRAEISAQLFAKDYVKNYYLKRPEMIRDRRLSAFLSMVDFSLDLFNKKMLRTYQSLIGNPLKV